MLHPTKLLVAVLAAASAFANQSGVFSGSTVTHTVPSVSAFTSLGTAVFTARIHNFTVPATETNIYANSGLQLLLSEDSEICAINLRDSLPSYGNQSCVSITGRSDFVAIVVRNTTALTWRISVVNAVGTSPADGYCGDVDGGATGNTFACPIGTLSNNWSGTGTLGAATFSIAWMKWFTATQSAYHEFLVATLGNWKFEGNGNDESTHNFPFGNGSYATSPTYNPACIISSADVGGIRAGTSYVLPNGSYSLNGTEALTYSWSITAGTGSLSSSTAATPTLTGANTFGQRSLSLTVTDSDTNNSACSRNFGFVPSDDNGTILSVAYGDPKIEYYLGPLRRDDDSLNEYTYLNEAQRRAAAWQASLLTVNPAGYGPYFDTAKSGTVSVSAGSATVNGTGTAFTTDYCQGPGSPTVPKSNARIIVWYTDGGSTGRAEYSVSSCTSDTVLTMGSTWHTQGGTVPAGSGYSHSYADDTQAWVFNSSPGNYYDNVAAFYAMYFRTGLTTYRNSARTLADMHYRHPRMDRGRICDMNSSKNNCWPERSQAMLGLVIYALEYDSTVWQGIRRIVTNRNRWLLQTYFQTQPYSTISDAREAGYALAAVAYCAYADPDSTERSTCLTALSNILVDPINKNVRTSDGSVGWILDDGWRGSANVASSSVNLQNGSATVNGTNTGWTAGNVNGKRVWFGPDPTPQPKCGEGGNNWDNAIYVATYVSATQITLDRVYEGSTDTSAGWMSAGGNNVVGCMGQPFMNGLFAQAAMFAGKALAASNPTDSAAYYEIAADLLEWTRNNGQDTTFGGLLYFAGNPMCTAPTPDDCRTIADGQEASRALGAELVRAAALSLQVTANASLETWIGNLMTNIWGKTGYTPAGDGVYWSGFNEGGLNVSGSPPGSGAAKWYGQCCGYGNSAVWPARAGIVSEPPTGIRTYSPSIRGATLR